MRRLIPLLGLLFATPALAQFPTPTFSSATMAQTGIGGTLATQLSLSRTEALAPTGVNPMLDAERQITYTDGSVQGLASLLVRSTIAGAPNGNVYPIIGEIDDNGLASTISPPGISQDTVFQSNVFKTVPGGGVPAGRKMRDEWNYWAQYFGANLPTSQSGADVVYEYDFNGNGLDDATIRTLGETIATLRVPLASGGYPLSINSARYLSSGGPDVWAHDWDTIGGPFSHAAIDLNFAVAAVSTVTSATPGSPVYSVVVDNIMPLESGGSAGGGAEFPVTSMAGHTATTASTVTASTSLPMSNVNYLTTGMFVFDITTPTAIPNTPVISAIVGSTLTITGAPVTIPSGDTLLFSRGLKHATINGHSYLVQGVVLTGAGTHAGTVYFVGPVTTTDAANGAVIYPNAHAIWLCGGSSTAPWCDIAFDATGANTLRSDGSGGLFATGNGLTAKNVTVNSTGVWSSNALGKGLLVTATGAGAPNPAIAIADLNGVNLWAIANGSGTLNFMAMPPYSDSTTSPILYTTMASDKVIIGGGTAAIDLVLPNAPTTCSGHPSKTVWNNAGVLNICP